MWKKLLTSALAASLLILPVNSVSPAHSEQAPAANQVLEYLPGRVPAQVSVEESMSPALHALVLALINQGAGSFDPADSELAWEGLYNMLSLYGQMDWRAEADTDALLLSAETVGDYAAALNASLAELGPMPAALEDRLTFNASENTYRAVCGEDGLSRIQVEGREQTAGGLRLTGALVFLPDGSALARFQVTLQPQDNMFGYAITGMELV